MRRLKDSVLLCCSTGESSETLNLRSGFAGGGRGDARCDSPGDSALTRKGAFRDIIDRGKTLLRRSEVEAFKPKPPGRPPKVKQSNRRIAR